ncbi:MAG: SCP2 domain-containing protein [Marinicellaceae bacterium]
MSEDINSQTKENNWFENVFIETVNKAMNKSLSYDIVSVKKLDAFSNKVIKVDLLSTPFEFYIKVLDRKVILSKSHNNDADTSIKGTPMALFAMSADEPISGIQNVEIFGDANTGQFFAKWLKNIKPDWEEAWCDLLGDGMGVRVSNMVHGLLDFGQNLKNAMLQNTQEYLVEESRDLIAPTEMEDFLDDVDDLKADTARLEQQINALKKPQ